METAVNMEMFILLSAARRYNNVVAHAGKILLTLQPRDGRLYENLRVFPENVSSFSLQF